MWIEQVGVGEIFHPSDTSTLIVCMSSSLKGSHLSHNTCCCFCETFHSYLVHTYPLTLRCSGSHPVTVAKKVLLDQISYGPVTNLIFLGFTGFVVEVLERHGGGLYAHGDSCLGSAWMRSVTCERIQVHWWGNR